MTGSGTPGSLDHDGLRQAAAQPAARQGHRQARSCPSSPTRRAPSAWTRSSRRSASTPRWASCYDPVDSNLVLSYREATDGQVLEEGITEAGSIGLVPGRRHVLRHPRRADDPVLHLLLDVRLPAHRRRVLGVRATRAAAASCWAPRPAARRSTARGCSTRTATALVLASVIPTRPRLRPGLRLRDRGHHPRRHPRGCTAPEPEDVFYYLTLYNENYVMPRAARGRHRRGHRARPVPLPGGAGAGRRARRGRPSWRPARSCSRRCAAQAILAERYGVAADVWSATVVPAAAQRGAGGRALEPAAIPASRAARAAGHASCWPSPPRAARSSR